MGKRYQSRNKWGWSEEVLSGVGTSHVELRRVWR